MKKTYFKKFLSYDGDRWSNYVLQKLQGCKSYVISGITLLMQLGLHEIQAQKIQNIQSCKFINFANLQKVLTWSKSPRS